MKEGGKSNLKAKSISFATVAGARNIGMVTCRQCRITLTSTESLNAIRGQDFAMAHLSEVAFWRSSPMHTPEDHIRSVVGSVFYGPGTLVVLESTANGVGNFFHREWLRAATGKSDKRAVFIPWHVVEGYSAEVTDYRRALEEMDDYELGLWNNGLTLEQIAWYHSKRKEYSFHSQMMAEFPSNHLEAFVSTASGVFAPELVERLRRDVTAPEAVGELHSAAPKGPDALKGLHFVADSRGLMHVWKFPAMQSTQRAGQRYVVGVDIGGVSTESDWSVITVMDCGLSPECKPEIAATWRGHIDHDLLTWKCAAIARWYCDALLVIESNTLECEHTDGDPSTYILNRIGRHYRNLYYRTDLNGQARQPGMHINRATKTALITELVAMVREGAFIERDARACDEFDQYERRPNGSFGAREGCHDDLLMTRALIAGALAERKVTPLKALARYLNA